MISRLKFGLACGLLGLGLAYVFCLGLLFAGGSGLALVWLSGIILPALAH